MIRAHVSIIRRCSDEWLNAGRLRAHPNKQKSNETKEGVAAHNSHHHCRMPVGQRALICKRRRAAFFSSSIPINSHRATLQMLEGCGLVRPLGPWLWTTDRRLASPSRMSRARRALLAVGLQPRCVCNVRMLPPTGQIGSKWGPKCGQNGLQRASTCTPKRAAGVRARAGRRSGCLAGCAEVGAGALTTDVGWGGAMRCDPSVMPACARPGLGAIASASPGVRSRWCVCEGLRSFGFVVCEKR